MSPRIHIFTTPRPLHEKIYTPPEHECLVIRQLIDYSPVIDSVQRASPDTVHGVKGLILLDDSNKFLYTHEYTNGNVLVLIYFQEDITWLGLLLANEFFSNRLGLDYFGRRPRTRYPLFFFFLKKFNFFQSCGGSSQYRVPTTPSSVTSLGMLRLGGRHRRMRQWNAPNRRHPRRRTRA